MPELPVGRRRTHCRHCNRQRAPNCGRVYNLIPVCSFATQTNKRAEHTSAWPTINLLARRRHHRWANNYVSSLLSRRAASKGARARTQTIIIAINRSGNAVIWLHVCRVSLPPQYIPTLARRGKCTELCVCFVPRAFVVVICALICHEWQPENSPNGQIAINYSHICFRCCNKFFER